MLLGALVGAGVPLGVMAEAVDKVAPGQVRLEVGAGDAAAGSRRPGATSRSTDTTDQPHLARRRATAQRGRPARGRPLAGPRRVLAARRGRGPGARPRPPSDVHFHEVGALDAIADVVGVCAGFVHLGLARVVVSSVSVGGGTVVTEHGRLPVPPPAVVELLRGVPTPGGPVDLELCTPTGAALLTTLADDWGSQPAMAVAHVGVGAGGRDPEGHANVLRVLVGESGFETLDPRASTSR